MECAIRLTLRTCWRTPRSRGDHHDRDEPACRVCGRGCRRRKHILCQKPMALTPEDCDRIAAAVAAAGVKLVMAYQMRHDPSNIRIKELVGEGALGRISLLRRRHCIPMLFSSDFVNGPTHWHIEPEKNMGMFRTLCLPRHGLHSLDYGPSCECDGGDR